MIIPTEGMPWPSKASKCIGGISSYGLSGINVHVILQEASGEEQNNVGEEKIERQRHL